MADGIVLSVVVASWNTVEFLRDLLRSLETHAPEAEVIVVDNASGDGSPEMVARDFPRARLLRNQRNEGYARACNVGAAVAGGRFVLLLGSDTRILDDSLSRMASYLADHPTVGGAAARLLNPDGTLQKSAKRFPRLRDGLATYLSLHRMAGRYNLADFDFERTGEIEQPATTCLMLRREIIEQGGLFDERYTILYNDVDLCSRIWRAGWTIVYLAEARVVHHGSQSTRRASPALRAEMYRNIMAWFHDTYGWRALVTLMPVLAARLAVVNRGKGLGRLLAWREGAPRSARTVAGSGWRPRGESPDPAPGRGL